MCFGGRGSSYTSLAAPVTLPPAPQISLAAPTILQSTPAPAGGSAMTNYQKKGKRALTIPKTSQVNVPGT